MSTLATYEGAGSLHACRQAPHLNVSTSGLSGMTCRPEGDAHTGQIAGKIIPWQYE
jgi:hypothetical protein